MPFIGDRMSSDVGADQQFSLSEAERSTLLQLAQESIAHGLRTGMPLTVDLDSVPLSLRRPGAAFVTLKRAGKLRGCIGSVIPTRPLAQDVATNAYSAAFSDPRFPPLTPAEYPDLWYEISVLSPLELVPGVTEADILSAIRPGRDGLVIEYGVHRGLLLPSVWESLPERSAFWAALKQKAGLPVSFWDPNVKVYRFETFAFTSDGKVKP